MHRQGVTVLWALTSWVESPWAVMAVSMTRLPESFQGVHIAMVAPLQRAQCATLSIHADFIALLSARYCQCCYQCTNLIAVLSVSTFLHIAIKLLFVSVYNADTYCVDVV